MTRIFFVSDPHGAEVVLRKSVATSIQYGADMLLFTGDLTGKAIVPIVKKGSDEWYSAPTGKAEYYHSRHEVEQKAQMWRDQGWYVIEMTKEEVEEVQREPKKMDDLFLRVMMESLDRWISIIEKEAPDGLRVVVSPGNDDAFEIDEVILKHERVIYPEEKVIELDNLHKMISCAWTSPTPWDTPRECSDSELKRRLEAEFKRVDNYENLICNFHDPPYGTVLDVAPKLDKTLKPVTQFGSVVMENVGSKAVRELIMKYQPLLGLHGHIHESPGHCTLGRTVCINPGSEYRSGIVRAYIIDLPKQPGDTLIYTRIEA